MPAETKICPFCGEEIKANAKKCRFCGEFLEGHTRESVLQEPEQAETPPPRADDGPRMVFCAKLGRVLPGLARPPVGGPLGERIFNQVSEQAWQMWLQHQVLLINHYGLSMANPEHRALLMEQLEEFFFGEGAQTPEGWTPEGTPGQKGGGPQQKK